MEAYLGIGSNLGDRLGNLQRAVDGLNDEPGVEVTASSRVWETDPVGGPPQPDFLNVVVAVRGALEPAGAPAEVEAGGARLQRLKESDPNWRF